MSWLAVVVAMLAGLVLATSALQDCVDKAVFGNNSMEVKRFTSKEGELLFFPVQGFQGVTIKLTVDGYTTARRVPREHLCVETSQWYSLKVTTVRYGLTYQQCTFQTNCTSGKCGRIHDYGYDEFESFTVDAHGASFWAIHNVTHKRQCSTPAADNYTSIVDSTTPAATNDTPVDDHTTPAGWLVGVAVGGAVAGLTVVIVTCIVLCRVPSLRNGLRAWQQQLRRSRSSTRPQSTGYINTGSVLLVVKNEANYKTTPCHPAPPSPAAEATTHNTDIPRYSKGT